MKKVTEEEFEKAIENIKLYLRNIELKKKKINTILVGLDQIPSKDKKIHDYISVSCSNRISYINGETTKDMSIIEFRDAYRINDLFKLKGFGKKCADELKELMFECGLDWRQKTPSN